MKERWRDPVRPLAVTEEPGWASSELGRATLEFSARFSQDDVERIRLGHVCLRCWEAQPVAFPEACGLCRYRMRDRQAVDFSEKFRGVQRNPRAVLIERELDSLDDKHDRRFHVPKLGIVVNNVTY